MAERREDGAQTERERAARRLAGRMGRIAHKILVLSGKGGVGKSTVAVNLAAALGRTGARVGILDVDVHGPSVPKLLGLEGRSAGFGGETTILPVEAEGLRVMSVGFLLRSAADAVIWRGPMKHNVISQLLGDVDWGDLDYLVIDAPPGTGDEPLSVCQLVPEADGAIVVTTPQDLSVADVRRSIGFCRQLSMRVLGVIENMSGFVCPKCGERVEVFKSGGGRRLADEMEVPFLGSVPLDPAIVEASDAGRPFVDRSDTSASAAAFSLIVDHLVGLAGTPRREPDAAPAAPARKDGHMRVAVPMAQGKLSLHFGHCEAFSIIDVEDGKIGAPELVPAPDHQPGLLPRWLAERGVNVVIAGGMGSRAQGLFAEQGIQVIVGAPREEPELLVSAYISGKLASGDNVCDH